ncbi:MAG: UDP-N-acetylmuramoyl-tripeptide--D-alanyl-D-alanine ligase [Cyanobium sp.]
MAVRFDLLLELWGEPWGPITGADLAAPIRTIRTDSRSDLDGALFVPLVGERFDGHRFLEAALERAVAAVVQRDRLEPAAVQALAERLSRPIWPVADTLLAYQQLARLWRRGLSAPVVAVTGSAGKTTTRELIRAALASLGPVLASSGNENNDVGVPLTLLKAQQSTAALVVEMGMRGLGEIERLSLCAEPDLAVITNIGTAHIGRLGSREAIATAKCEITAALRSDGLIVIPGGDPLLERALAAVWSGRVLRIGLADELDGWDPCLPPADLVGMIDAEGDEAPDTAARQPAVLSTDSGGGPRGSACRQPRLRLQDGGVLPLPLDGRHNARNLLLAVAVARELGVPQQALSALEVEVPGGRSRRLQIGGVEVLDETYNASPEAMLASLELLAGASPDPSSAGDGPRRRYAVLGTMLELGDLSLALHRQVAARALELGLDGLVIVASGEEGQAMLEAGAGLARLVRVDTPAQALEPLATWLKPGDLLLLKASRGIALEQLLPLLEAALV